MIGSGTGFSLKCWTRGCSFTEIVKVARTDLREPIW